MGQLDRRLVMVILIHRHHETGLLISELDNPFGPDRGQAGTKRIAKPLHSTRWAAQWITEYLWDQGGQAVNA
jgi:hypothetical protein